MASLATIIAAYEDNADYSETNDIAKAKLFETACRRLLVKLPQRVRSGGGEETEVSIGDVRAELDAVRTWSGGRDATSGTRGVQRTKINYTRPTA